MCFNYQLEIDIAATEARYNAKVKDPGLFNTGNFNGFTFPRLPVITNKEPDLIQFYSWGLIPFWAKDREIQKNTLNARIETIAEKPSFRNCVQNRCLIPATAFYEWQWLDEKGKLKQKYKLTINDQDVFSFAGIYSTWVDNGTGEIVNSFSILTMDANQLMAEIHNTKKRMPVIISSNDEQNWLSGGELNHMNDDLIATKV